MFTESHGPSMILKEDKDRILEIHNEEAMKENHTTFDQHPSWLCSAIFQDPLLNAGGEFYSHDLLLHRLRRSLWFVKNPTAGMPRDSAGFWKTYL